MLMLASFCRAEWARRSCARQNERDGAGLRSSVAAATPSQLRRSSVAAPSQQRCAHHERSTGHWAAPRIICRRNILKPILRS